MTGIYNFRRRSGHLDNLPLALLARPTAHDLAEAYTIAIRSGMRLHLTDYHLIQARRLRSKEHLEQAVALISETGYHRRDAEVQKLRGELGWLVPRHSLSKVPIRANLNAGHRTEGEGIRIVEVGVESAEHVRLANDGRL